MPHLSAGLAPVRSYPKIAFSSRKNDMRTFKIRAIATTPTTAPPPGAVVAPPGTPPIVILPGFGNASRDYLSPFGNEDASLAAALCRRGFSPHVVEVDRRDWLRVGRMAFTPAFWRSECTTAQGYAWYLERVKDAIDTARETTGSEKVIFVGHSAGGWLARAFIGQKEWKDNPLSSGDEDPHESVAALVTLGTPHAPPPAGSEAKDMTGGALTWVNTRWPGAYFASSGVKYVSVGSRAIRGDESAPKGTVEKYAAGSYRQVAGAGNGIVGDAVVPLASALLEGSTQIELDNVMHSMSRLGTFEDESEVAWYGTCASVVDLWLQPLVVVQEQ